MRYLKVELSLWDEIGERGWQARTLWPCVLLLLKENLGVIPERALHPDRLSLQLGNMPTSHVRKGLQILEELQAIELGSKVVKVGRGKSVKVGWISNRADPRGDKRPAARYRKRSTEEKEENTPWGIRGKKNTQLGKKNTPWGKKNRPPTTLQKRDTSPDPEGESSVTEHPIGQQEHPMGYSEHPMGYSKHPTPSSLENGASSAGSLQDPGNTELLSGITAVDNSGPSRARAHTGTGAFRSCVHKNPQEKNSVKKEGPTAERSEQLFSFYFESFNFAEKGIKQRPRKGDLRFLKAALELYDFDDLALVIRWASTAGAYLWQRNRNLTAVQDVLSLSKLPDRLLKAQVWEAEGSSPYGPVSDNPGWYRLAEEDQKWIVVWPKADQIEWQRLVLEDSVHPTQAIRVVRYTRYGYL